MVRRTHLFPTLAPSTLTEDIWEETSEWEPGGVQSCPTLCDPMNCSTPGFLSFTNSQSLLKLMSIELVMPSNHLILCRPPFLLPSIFHSIGVFSNESLCIRWPEYWSFSFSPCCEYSELISFRINWFELAIQVRASPRELCGGLASRTTSGIIFSERKLTLFL